MKKTHAGVLLEKAPHLCERNSYEKSKARGACEVCGIHAKLLSRQHSAAWIGGKTEADASWDRAAEHLAAAARRQLLGRPCREHQLVHREVAGVLYE
jgi:hypothetical protein